MDESQERGSGGEAEMEVKHSGKLAAHRSQFARIYGVLTVAMIFAVASAEAGGDGTSGAFLGPVNTFLCSVAQFFSGPFALLTAVATVPLVLVGAGSGMVRGSAALKVIFYCLVALMSVSLIASALNAFNVDFTAGTNCTIQNLDAGGGE